jgi:hypothetical protein
MRTTTGQPPEALESLTSPEREAAYRSARLGSRVVAGTLGGAAALLTLVALLFALDFASDLAETWGELLKLAGLAIAVTLALAGAPLAAALMSRTYPAEAKQALMFWRAALALTAIGGALFVATAETPAQRSAARASARAAELRQEFADRGGGEWDIWKASGNCEKPQSPQQQTACAAIPKQRAQQFAELQSIERGEWRDSSWTPRAIVGDGQFAGLGGTNAVRGLLTLAVFVAAVAGAGILGRLAVLASAESYRLVEGAASPIPTASGPLASIAETSAIAPTPAHMFDLWFQAHVRHDPSGRLAVTSAFDDYVRACTLNDLPPANPEKFRDLLAWKADTSGGRIRQENSGNDVSYEGLALAGDHKCLPVVDIGSDGGTVVALSRRS